ncbi:MAG: hypothetical protein IIB57_02630 [Planctomycetes bacterium]|nr:hypothetical protein [Planctomycetota bacterium]
MWDLKRIIQFAVVFAVVYGGLMFLRTPLAGGYARVFRGCGNFAFSRYVFWGDGSVRFVDLRLPRSQLFTEIDRNTYGMLPIATPILKLKGELDTLMLLKNRTMGDFGMLRTSSRLVGYLPTAVIVALFLATPTTWRKRLWGLAIGLVLVHVYIYGRLAIDVATGTWGFGSAKPYALFSLSDFWSGVLTRVSEVVAENPTVYLGVSVFIWLFVSIVSGSFTAFRRPTDPAAESSSE